MACEEILPEFVGGWCILFDLLLVPIIWPVKIQKQGHPDVRVAGPMNVITTMDKRSDDLHQGGFLSVLLCLLVGLFVLLVFGKNIDADGVGENLGEEMAAAVVFLAAVVVP